MIYTTITIQLELLTIQLLFQTDYKSHKHIITQQMIFPSRWVLPVVTASRASGFLEKELLGQDSHRHRNAVMNLYPWIQ